MPLNVDGSPDRSGPPFAAVRARRLSITGWLARTAGVLTVFAAFAVTAAAVLTRGELLAGRPSWAVDCHAAVRRLEYWYSFTAELANSFLTPDESHCREQMANTHADPRVTVAYSIALIHRGSRKEAIAALEQAAARGQTPAVHALASIYTDLILARRLGISDPLDRAIGVLRGKTFQPDADTDFLLFKALNMTKRADLAPEAALSLLKSLSQGSKAAIFYLQTVPLLVPQSELQPATKKAVKSILRALELTQASDDDFATIEDYVALIKFVEARPEVGADGCINIRLSTVCPQTWRWRLMNEAVRERLERAPSIDVLLDVAVDAATAILDVPRSMQTPEVVRMLQSSASLSYSIGALSAALRLAQVSGEVHECDRLAAHPYDPHRTGLPVEFDAIDAEQTIAACDRAIEQLGPLPRFLYQRGRAHSRAQHSAAQGNHRESLRRSSEAKSADFKAAARLGYPMAFNNLAVDIESSVDEHQRYEAASLHVQALNHVLQCCWPPVARKLLESEETIGVSRTRRVIRELTAWSAALGNPQAAQILREIAVPIPSPAVATDTPPWLLGPQ